MRLLSPYIVVLLILVLSVAAAFSSGHATASAADLSGYKICLDPGHGGSDPGAIGVNGVREKDINLAIALKAAYLLKLDGAQVYLTRSGDYYVSLADRVNYANSVGCHIFISIHANAATDSSATGFEVYHYYTSTKGRQLATLVADELAEHIPLRNRGVKQDGFYVLKYTAMPAILIETGFVTNSYDVSILTNEKYQWEYARAILHGVQRYFGVPEHDPVPTVTNIRYAQHEGYFRVVIDLTKLPSQYYVYYTNYSQGYRLVVQINSAQLVNLGWSINSDGWYYRSTGYSTVTKIYAKQSGDKVFILIELSSPYRPYKTFTLTNPDRIVVDIYFQ